MTTRRNGLWLGVMLAALSLSPAGCRLAQDAMVDRHLTELASDLETRRQLERAAIDRQYEQYRAAKREAILGAREDCLKFLEVSGKLNSRSAVKTVERFAAMEETLNRMVDQAKATALQSTDWYHTAAETVLASSEYRRTKDYAPLKGLEAGLDAFARGYVAARAEPASEAEAQADRLVEQFRVDLQAMLEQRFGIVLPLAHTN